MRVTRHKSILRACALTAAAITTLAAPASAQLSEDHRIYLLKTSADHESLSGAQFDVRSCSLGGEQKVFYTCTQTRRLISTADGFATDSTTGQKIVANYSTGSEFNFGPAVMGFLEVTEVAAPSGYQRTPVTRYFAGGPEGAWKEVKGTSNLLNIQDGDTTLVNTADTITIGSVSSTPNPNAQLLSWLNSPQKATPDPTPSNNPTPTGGTTPRPTAPHSTTPATPTTPGTTTTPGIPVTGPKVQTDYETPLKTTAPLLLGGLVFVKVTTSTLARRQKNKRN